MIKTKVTKTKTIAEIFLYENSLGNLPFTLLCEQWRIRGGFWYLTPSPTHIGFFPNKCIVCIHEICKNLGLIYILNQPPPSNFNGHFTVPLSPLYMHDKGAWIIVIIIRTTDDRDVLTLDVIAYRAGLLLGRVRQRLDALQYRVPRLGRAGRRANGPVARLLLLLELQSHVRSFGRRRGSLGTRRFGRVLPLLGALLRLRPGRRRPVGGSHRRVGIVRFRG